MAVEVGQKWNWKNLDWETGEWVKCSGFVEEIVDSGIWDGLPAIETAYVHGIDENGKFVELCFPVYDWMENLYKDEW